MLPSSQPKPSTRKLVFATFEKYAFVKKEIEREKKNVCAVSFHIFFVRNFDRGKNVDLHFRQNFATFPTIIVSNKVAHIANELPLLTSRKCFIPNVGFSNPIRW